MKKSPEKYYALLPLVLLCAYFVYKAIGHPVHDFANYYFGGYLLGEHRFTPEIYFPHWFNLNIVALGHQPLFAGFAPNTPFLALLFSPIAMLPIGIAKLMFNIVSVALLIFSMNRLITFYKINPVYVLFIPVLFFIPLRNEIMFGQVYLLLFFFIAESWFAYEKQQFRKSAIFLSLAIMLKVFPILLLAVFLFRKQFRLVAYVMVSCLALVAVTLFFCTPETWLFYLSDVLPKASAGGIASAYVTNYQSILMFLKQLLVFDATENPNALLNIPTLFPAILTGFKLFLLTVGFYITKKSAGNSMVIAYWSLAIILMSPYGSTYTFILMLFPFFAVMKSEVATKKKALLIALLFLVNNLPLSVFMLWPFPFSYLRLVALLLFFGLLSSMVRNDINWKKIAAATLIPMVAILLLHKDERKTSAYFLGKSPLLIYDYKIADGRLTYFYWNQNGENTGSVALKASRIQRADLTRNAIYYFGKRIPTESGNNRKPIVIDGTTLLYLSDHDRGIGFYTLRKIDLR
jgi:hypothetical protein